MGSRAMAHPADWNLSGIARLVEDFQKLLEDKDAADVLFVVGKEEKHVYAHRTILIARCKSFQNLKRGELCRVSSGVVTVSPGTVTSNFLPKVKLPNYTPEIFHSVLTHVYTGKVSLHDSTALEVMTIAADLGIEDLRVICEDHLNSTLSVKNACLFLAKAVDIQDRVGGSKSLIPFLDRYISFIGENASECVRTQEFLNLPKEALIRLISSDQLAMEEEDVWRAVLSWSKDQAEVTSPPQAWNQAERTRMSVFLSGVINHVRLLLIDSQVFAEEVEPTGLVPIEVSLERYRIAAVPPKFSETEEKRLKPRTSTKFFPGSSILSQSKTALQKTLNAWYGNPQQQWRMVYRAGVHGFSSEAFHKHCDGAAPTYVIILGLQGHVCGGFSDIPWGKSNPKGRYVSSDNSFVFSLVNNQGIPPSKFDVVKKMYALCLHQDCGPIFGAGSDLFIASNANENMESYSNFPHSYDGDDASPALLMGEYNFSVLDYEVFTPVMK